MAEFRLTAAAARDLDDIFDYGAGQWGADQAASYVASLAERFALLGDFPGIGSARDDIEPGIRSTPCGSHIVYFSSDACITAVCRMDMSEAAGGGPQRAKPPDSPKARRAGRQGLPR